MSKSLKNTLACASALAALLAGPAQAEAQLRLNLVGDVMLDDGPGKVIADGRDPFAPMATLLADADYTIGNLETPVATTGRAMDSKIFTFRAHPRVLPVLKKHFDALALANNHSGDYGRAAFAEMLGLLNQAGLAAIGGGHNLREAHTPWIVERKGLRIALLAYSEFMPRSFEADFDAPGVAWSEDEQVVHDIRQARSRYRADLVIPMMHWGWENERVANARQRQLARVMIDAGADAVIGGHPHVRQDIEIVNGKPVVYSVGNFVMKETDNANQRIGWVLELTLGKAGVVSWRTHTAAIDMEGIPTPAAVQSSPCGERGQEKPGVCSAAP